METVGNTIILAPVVATILYFGWLLLKIAGLVLAWLGVKLYERMLHPLLYYLMRFAP